MNKVTASGLICPNQFYTCSPIVQLVLFYDVPQQVHHYGQWLGKRQHGCPLTWWSRGDPIAYQFVSFCINRNISGLKNISNISQGELSWVIWKFLFIPSTPENARFWTDWICSFHPHSKSGFAHSGRALCVLFLPLSGSGWTTSSSSLLLKCEFTLHMSLSEVHHNYHSLSLNHSQFHLFSDKHFMWSIFWTKPWSRFFRFACSAPNINWR